LAKSQEIVESSAFTAKMVETAMITFFFLDNRMGARAAFARG
jgi:hypothetical protein